MHVANVPTPERQRLCFILEHRYREDRMPLVVIDRLRAMGHRVDVALPGSTSARDLVQGDYDACVLKTASEGAGIDLLEAARAAGIPAINRPRSIRRVRDKAMAMAWAQIHGLPVPTSFLALSLQALDRIGREHYPLVVKPNRGSDNRGVHLIESPAQLRGLQLDDAGAHGFLVQRYAENPGYDLKLYNTGGEVFGVRRASPLHAAIEPGLVPLSRELRDLALAFGRAFELDVYGVDVVQTPGGWVAVDVNDFPSFGHVPCAVERLADSIAGMVVRTGRRSGRAGLVHA